MIFPEKLAIKLIDEQGHRLRIADLAVYLLIYRSKDDFWEHRSSLGIKVGNTNNEGIFEASRQGFDEKWDEARRMYPMDYKSYEEYQDYVSITLGGGWDKGKRAKGESVNYIYREAPRSDASPKDLVEDVLIQTCFDYSLKGITPDQVVDVEIPVVGFNSLPLNEGTLRPIKSPGEKEHLRQAFEKNARKGAYLQVFGQPFEKPMNSPLFLIGIEHSEEGLFLDFSDEHEGLVRIALEGLRSYLSLSSEINIYCERIKIEWAFTPKRYWESIGLRQWFLESEGGSPTLVHMSRHDPFENQSSERDLETESPGIKIWFYSIWP